MKLLPGYSVREHKHHARAWQPEACLSINSGVVTENGNNFPRDDWRPLSQEELEILTQSDKDTGYRHSLQLFNIPDRLHELFWDLDLEQVVRQLNNQVLVKSYGDFVDQLAEFLRFIEAPVPRRCEFQTMISALGQRSTRVDPSNKNTLGLKADRCYQEAGELMAASVNMGDETRSMVWLNLCPLLMRNVLERQNKKKIYKDEASLRNMVNNFLAEFPQYPILRLNIEPGQGIFFPFNCFIYDGYTMEMDGPDFNIMITPE